MKYVRIGSDLYGVNEVLLTDKYNNDLGLYVRQEIAGNCDWWIEVDTAQF